MYATGFAAGVNKILTDENVSRKIVEQAADLAEKKYSYSAYLKKTKDVYDYLENLHISTKILY